MTSALARRIEDVRGDGLQGLPQRVTLLELVEAVSAVTDDDKEVAATVLSMLLRGRVRLCGNFCGEAVESFED